MFPHSLPIIKRLAAIISFLKVSLVNEVLQRVHPLIPHPLHGHLRIQRPSPSQPPSGLRTIRGLQAPAGQQLWQKTSLRPEAQCRS